MMKMLNLVLSGDKIPDQLNTVKARPSLADSSSALPIAAAAAAGEGPTVTDGRGRAIEKS